MNRLVFTESDYGIIQSAIAVDPASETCIFFHGLRHESTDGIRYLVRKVVVPPAEAFEERTPVSVLLKSDYVGRLVQQVRGECAFVGFLHNHPGISQPSFSMVDDTGERRLAPFLKSRFNSPHHVSAIVGGHRWIAREIGQLDGAIEIVVVGRGVRRLSSFGDEPSVDEELHDRQIKAFGPMGQRALRALRVAIVGVGGTGSVVAQQLAYLGVGHLRLLDFDVVDRTNLNRLVGATPDDVGNAKVETVASHVRRIAPGCEVNTDQADVLNNDVALSLLREDLVFGCLWKGPI